MGNLLDLRVFEYLFNNKSLKHDYKLYQED